MQKKGVHKSVEIKDMLTKFPNTGNVALPPLQAWATSPPQAPLLLSRTHICNLTYEIRQRWREKRKKKVDVSAKISYCYSLLWGTSSPRPGCSCKPHSSASNLAPSVLSSQLPLRAHLSKRPITIDKKDGVTSHDLAHTHIHAYIHT